MNEYVNIVKYDISRVTRQTKKVRVILFSDTHGFFNCFPNPHNLPEADLLVFAGDVSRTGKREEILAFDEFLGKINIPHKVIIPGNHDFFLYQNPDFRFRNCVCLVNQFTKILGLNIYGTPYSEETPKIKNYKCYQFIEDKKFLVDIPNDEEIDILISHAPPRGILDSAYQNKYEPDEDKKMPVGSPHILTQIQRTNPRVCVFGHIHEDYGQFKSNDYRTVFLNASIINGRSTEFDEGKGKFNLPFYTEIYVNESNGMEDEEQDEGIIEIAGQKRKREDSEEGDEKILKKQKLD